jgi:hypothetical protein
MSHYKTQQCFVRTGSFSSFTALICGTVLKHALFIGLDIQCALCIVKFCMNHCIFFYATDISIMFLYIFNLYVTLCKGLWGFKTPQIALRVWILKQQSDFCRTQIRLKGDTGR